MADPQEIRQTTTTIPDYAKPYVEDLLGQAQSLTDISQNPYMQYQGERVAQFSPLQQQAYQNAALMQTAPQLQDASAVAGTAALGALNTGYAYDPYKTSSFTSPGTAQQYMSPYMQSVVDVQQQEAQRQADIAGTQRGAQAVGAGAFGGSRQAIMDAEAARNLATQKGSIQAQGLQSAYTQAQAQYNADQARQMQAAQLGEQSKQYGAGLGLQGLSTALQGAGQMGQLGGQQFQQGMDINKLQQATGATEQAQQQAALTQQYQDFIAQKQYPYQQLSYMSDMLRGLPMSQSTQSLFQAPPSAASTAVGLGTAAYGISRLAKGGKVKEKQRPAGLAELAISRMA